MSMACEPSFQFHRRSAFTIALLVAATGCGSTNSDLPEIAKPLGYGTVRVSLTGCPIELPPVREDPGCGADQIGKTILYQDVCRLLTSLKRWVESSPTDGQLCSPELPTIKCPPLRADDWKYVRAVCVS